jgi:hypothetical protein
VLGPTRVVVPTRDFANGVVQLEASESLEAMPARVDPPDVRFRLLEGATWERRYQRRERIFSIFFHTSRSISLSHTPPSISAISLF